MLIAASCVASKSWTRIWTSAEAFSLPTHRARRERGRGGRRRAHVSAPSSACLRMRAKSQRQPCSSPMEVVSSLVLSSLTTWREQRRGRCRSSVPAVQGSFSFPFLSFLFWYTFLFFSFSLFLFSFLLFLKRVVRLSSDERQTRCLFSSAIAQGNAARAEPDYGGLRHSGLQRPP